MAKKFTVIGWYPNISPARRSASNISDGARFSTRELAEAYAKDKQMKVNRIAENDVPDDDPEIDWMVRLGHWTPPKT